MVDWVVVGAGFTGATAAERLASQCGKQVLVVERRKHVGGNAHDAIDSKGALSHVYGPHIFHTNSKRVWEYLSQFTEWSPYFHRVTAVVEGQCIPIPFNLSSVRMCFPPSIAERICNALIDEHGFGGQVSILKLKSSHDQYSRLLAQFVYENVFLGYTRKQWGVSPEELKASVTDRVPIRMGMDSRYFTDIYQALPASGYTSMFNKMLSHPNIKLLLETDWNDIKNDLRGRNVLFTGAVDEYFDYGDGVLQYRTVSFREQIGSRVVGPTAQTNFPNNFDFTRLTNMKALTNTGGEATKFVAEYPSAYTPGLGEPYYPVPSGEAEKAYEIYSSLARSLRGRVWFAGRLADYQYYNMDQACARGLAIVEKELSQA